MGSSRSGLVGSPYACEGSKTGFYTDDFEDLTFKRPEEVRKANLCGADLRDARADGVDFYLVDLRAPSWTLRFSNRHATRAPFWKILRSNAATRKALVSRFESPIVAPAANRQTGAHE